MVLRIFWKMISYYQDGGNNMSNLKPKKNSMIEFTKKYANNPKECLNFFIKVKFPDGFTCDKCGCKHYYFLKGRNVLECKECGHQHYLFAGTIFEKNKLELYKLLLGLYLFFTSNKGLSAIEMASNLDVNYKTALLLCRKCRILMSYSNSEKILDALFYEADTVYIGAKSKNDHCQGCGTEQQPFLIVLSTARENRYPEFIKLHLIPVDNANYMTKIIEKSIVLSKERTLNTDGKTTFASLAGKIKLKSEKIDYTQKEHRLKWLNIIVGNIKNNILGIYRGVDKRNLPLFLNEQQWRINHRNSGKTILDKIANYIQISTPHSRKSIITTLNLAEPYFTPRACV